MHIEEAGKRRKELALITVRYPRTEHLPPQINVWSLSEGHE
jgi:hypothetical protein